MLAVMVAAMLVRSKCLLLNIRDGGAEIDNNHDTDDDNMVSTTPDANNIIDAIADVFPSLFWCQMLQGDAGGPLVSCGRDGNCGTTPGMNYEVIGDLSIIKTQKYHAMICIGRVG